MTTSEWLNFGMLVFLFLTLIYTRVRHKSEDERSSEAVLNKHLLECAEKNGIVETTLKSLQKDVEKVDRKVDNVGAQIKLLAAEADNRFIITERRVEPEGRVP